jgi:hypothetical protein
MIAHNVWWQAGRKTGWQLAAGSASRTVARQPAAAARKMGQAANPQPTDYPTMVTVGCDSYRLSAVPQCDSSSTSSDHCSSLLSSGSSTREDYVCTTTPRGLIDGGGLRPDATPTASSSPARPGARSARNWSMRRAFGVRPSSPRTVWRIPTSRRSSESMVDVVHARNWLKAAGSRLHHLSASDLGRRGPRPASGGRRPSLGRTGHCASDLGRGRHRRASGRRGSGPRPSCRPTLDPTTGRGTSDNRGTARVGPVRRQPPPNPRALNRRSLRPLMLRCVRCFSSRSGTRSGCR